MGIFSKWIESREQKVDENVISDPILNALLGKDEVNRDIIMNIPAISSCINIIGDTVASLPVKLYKRDGDKVCEIEDDERVALLNGDTGDTLDAVQLKKAMVMDMFLERGGYAYVHKVAGKVRSIHYVESNRIGFQRNTDPIFKDYRIEVGGHYYEGWQFIKLLRNTQNGFYGKSIIEESPVLIGIVYSSQLFEKNMVKTGGNKKGFIKATSRLSKEAMAALKAAFRKLYSNNTENVVILNDGLDFKESSNTSVELQLNENKRTNNDDICKIFQVPPPIINGGGTEEDKKQYHQGCILPIIHRFASAINQVLLTEDEKKNMFFAFDDTDLIKGDTEKRFNAYKLALDSGFMQLDEVRKKEKLPAFDLNFIKLGLQDVIYYPKTNQIYTPNTNKLSAVGEGSEKLSNIDMEGGEVQNEDTNQE